MENELWLHKVSFNGTKGECLVAASPVLNMGYFFSLLLLLGILDSLVVEPTYLSRMSAALFLQHRPCDGHHCA